MWTAFTELTCPQLIHSAPSVTRRTRAGIHQPIEDTQAGLVAPQVIPNASTLYASRHITRRASDPTIHIRHTEAAIHSSALGPDCSK